MIAAETALKVEIEYAAVLDFQEQRWWSPQSDFLKLIIRDASWPRGGLFALIGHHHHHHHHPITQGRMEEEEEVNGSEQDEDLEAQVEPLLARQRLAIILF